MRDLLMDGKLTREVRLDQPIVLRPGDSMTVSLTVDFVVNELTESHEIVGICWSPIVRKDDE